MDIIFFGAIDWNDPRRFPVHHVVERLALEHRVFYIDNFGCVRDLRYSDMERGVKKFLSAFRSRTGGALGNSEHPNVVVYQPFIVPTPRLPNTIGRLNSSLIARGVQDLIRTHDIVSPVVWTRAATRVAWEAIQQIDYSLLVYQVVDKFPHNPVVPPSLQPRHQRAVDEFTRSADLIFASARSLRKERQRVNENVYFFPNGVEVEKFYKKDEDLIDPFEGLQHPIFGFIGTVDPRIQVSLLETVARRQPDWSFVFIGPVTSFAQVDALKECPNVYFLGPVDHDDLPRYCHFFDVGFIPYERTFYTEHTFPSKLAEYLAAGLPVVSSDIPEMRHYVDVVGIYRDAEEFIRVAQREMNDDSKKTASRRLETAQSLSWDHIVNGMISTIKEHTSRSSPGIE